MKLDKYLFCLGRLWTEDKEFYNTSMYRIPKYRFIEVTWVLFLI